MTIQPNAAPAPRVTRRIGAVERYLTITGHTLYALATCIIVFITNCLLAILAQLREFLSTMMEAPHEANIHINIQNDIFQAQSEEEEEVRQEVEAELVKPVEEPKKENE